MEENNVLENIFCVPATIRKCDGFVIEADTSEPKKTEILTALKILQSKGYKTHGLAYTENDKYEPKEIFNGSVMGTNKFGWFVTKEKMEFPSSSLSSNIQLSTRNKVYYKQEKKGRYGLVLAKCTNFTDGSKVKISEMIEDSPIMNQLTFIRRGLNCIKEIRSRYSRKLSEK